MTGGQGHALAGVHLPDLMRPRGAACVGGGPPSRRRGGEVGPSQPALERAFGGQGARGELRAQHHADQSRAPTRVFAAEAQDRLDERLGGPRRAGPAVVVRGVQGGSALAAEPLDQTANGARIEGPSSGDGGDVLVVAGAFPDGFADGNGKRARHGRSSVGDPGRVLSQLDGGGLPPLGE